MADFDPVDQTVWNTSAQPTRENGVGIPNKWSRVDACTASRARIPRFLASWPRPWGRAAPDSRIKLEGALQSSEQTEAKPSGTGMRPSYLNFIPVLHRGSRHSP
jgi:hypothetical protein